MSLLVEQTLETLIKSRQPGHGLAGDFYNDVSDYQADIDRIWRRGWLFAGHSYEISEPGDYFTFAVENDSIIVIRDESEKIWAFYNMCRHRGTILCQQPSGHIGKRLVCPYHQWAYAKNGQLVSCWGMQKNIDKSDLGLIAVHLRELDGMIYVCLADEPKKFDPAYKMMSLAAKPQGMEQAKVAKIVDYHVNANWKVVWENNRECYHCNANHPQYIKANFDHYNSDDTSDRIKKQIELAVDRSEEKWAASGLSVTHKQTGMTCFPDPDQGIWYSANRTPLVDGYLSESMNGAQVAPLMGEYADPDVGTFRMRTMPNMWMHGSCDHAVTTRLLPAGPCRTQVRVYWLVDANAVEGRDYELDELMPFWQLTSEQDWELCERVQRGVSISRYRPGPYSTFKEYNVDAFVRWYLQELSLA